MSRKKRLDDSSVLSVFMTFVSHKSNNLFTYIFKMCKCEYNKSEKNCTKFVTAAGV